MTTISSHDACLTRSGCRGGRRDAVSEVNERHRRNIRVLDISVVEARVEHAVAHFLERLAVTS
jgi:hypothetical protein